MGTDGRSGPLVYTESGGGVGGLGSEKADKGIRLRKRREQTKKGEERKRGERKSLGEIPDWRSLSGEEGDRRSDHRKLSTSSRLPSYTGSAGELLNRSFFFPATI